MKTNKELTELYILVITIPKGKKEIIGDLLEPYDVTCYLSLLAHGAHTHELTKEVMFAVIKKTKIKDAIFSIEDKFKKFHSNMSMVYAIPMENIIGLQSYMALTNGGKR